MENGHSDTSASSDISVVPSEVVVSNSENFTSTNSNSHFTKSSTNDVAQSQPEEQHIHQSFPDSGTVGHFPTYKRYLDPTNTPSPNSLHHLPLVSSGLPYLNPSGYSAPVNLINPVADPTLLAGYHPATLVPSPHLATYSPSPGGPLVIRPTGLPYVTNNTLSGSSPNSDMQVGSHQAQSIRYMIPSMPETSAPLEDISLSSNPTANNQQTSTPNINSLTSPVSDSISNPDIIDHAHGEYYVMFHVDAGANFSVRVGDQIQHIPGPATVRMVSNSGPPVPMPMQVPAGHLVQQIVDEEGILKHVILSLYPGPTPPSTANPQSACGRPGASVIVDPSQQFHRPPPDTGRVASLGGPYSPQYGHAHPATLTGHHFHSPFVAHHPHIAQIPAHHFHPPPISPFVTSQLIRPTMDSKGGPETIIGCTHTNLAAPEESKECIQVEPVALHTDEPAARIDDSNEQSQSKSDPLHDSHEVLATSPKHEKQTRSSTETKKKNSSSSTKTKSKNSGVANSDHLPVAPTSFAAVAALNSTDSGKGRSNRVPTDNTAEQSRTSVTCGSSEASVLDPRLPPTNGHAPSNNNPPSNRRRGRAGVGKSHGTSRGSHHTPNSSSKSTTNGSTNAANDSEGRRGWTASSDGNDAHNPNGSRHPRAPLNAWPHGVNHRNGRRSHPPVEQNRTFCSKADHPSSVYLLDEGELFEQSQSDATWDQEAIHRVLSAVNPPQVSDIKSHSALIHLTLPSTLTVEFTPAASATDQHCDVTSPYPTQTSPTKQQQQQQQPGLTKDNQDSSQQMLDSSWSLDENAIQFELHLAERDSATRFNCVFIGEATEISLQDLRPGSDYFVKFCCVYGEVRGQFSTPVRFTTLSTEPSAPRNLTVTGHTRTSLQLKWNAAADNGSRITAYCVEYAPALTRQHFALDSDPSHTDSDFIPNFIEGYRGLARTCKLTQLTPSTTYLLRVMAQNSHGSSPWSSVVAGSTSGSPPPTPPNPYLVSAGVHSLALAWHPAAPHRSNANPKRLSFDVSYTLEMDDEAMGHGFVTVFDGTGTEHCVENLRRNTRYRFRLAASNVDGRSRWTDVIVLSTLPDRPSAPRNLRVTDPAASNRVTFSWDPPSDDGGLPVRAYQLELCLPLKSISSDEFVEEESVRLDSIESLQASLLCWPNVKGLSGQTLFASSHDYGNSSRSAPKLLRSPSTDLDTPVDSVFLFPAPTEHDQLADCARSTDAKLFKWFIVYEGSGTVVTMNNLLPGLHLLSRVRAVTTPPDSSDLFGVASSPPVKIVIPPVPPSAPSAPRMVGHPESNSLHLSWSPPRSNGGAPVFSYELMQADTHSASTDLCSQTTDAIQSTSNSTLHDVLQRTRSLDRFLPPRCSCTVVESKSAHTVHTITQPGCRVADLCPGHTYAFRVRACNVVGRSPWSTVTKLSTLACPPDAPAKPPRVLPISPVQVKVMWDAVIRTNGAPVSEYWLEWSDRPSSSGESDKFQMIYCGSEVTYEFNNARPATHFAFRYCAVNDAGPGGWSPIGSCLTPCTPPSQLPSIKVISRVADSTTIQWALPESNGFPVTSYQIELTQVGSNTHAPVEHQLIETPSTVPVMPSTSFKYSVPTVEHVLTPLKPNMTYQIRVRALNSLGYGPFSVPLAFTTLPLPPLRPVFGAPTHVTATSVRLQWNLSPTDASSPGSTTRFRLQSSLDPESEWSTIFEGPDCAFKVTRLTENTTCYFRIQAINVAGAGEWSDTICVTTPRLSPPIVRGLRVSVLGADGCQLDWSSVSIATPDPIVYLVHVLPVAEQSTVANPQAQVYRTSVNSLRITDLDLNTDYVCRVCAIRLCCPSDSMPALNDDSCPNGTQSVDLDPSIPTAVRTLVNTSVTQLPGPFSHSLHFTTRAPSVENHGSSSGSPSNSPARESMLSKLSAFLFHPRLNRDLSTSWRRRLLAKHPTSPTPGVKSTVHHNSPIKRHPHTFRLTDRKLAVLFVLLFALITFLISWSLMCLLNMQSSSGFDL